MLHPYKEIIAEVTKKDYQEKVIEYLRSLNFQFMNFNTIKQYKDGLEPLSSYQFMVRRIRSGTGYDFKLVFAIKIMGDHLDQYFYRWKDKPLVKVDCEWKVGKILNFKKKKVLTKFPDSLDIEERKVWRKIDDKLLRARPLKPGERDWYILFIKDMVALNPHIEHFKNYL